MPAKTHLKTVLPRLLHRRGKKLGMAPGSVIHVASDHLLPCTGPVAVSVFHYSADHCNEMTMTGIQDYHIASTTPATTWINVSGLHDIELLQALGQQFNIPPLVLEDIADTGQRPKIEIHGPLLFVVMKMIYQPSAASGTAPVPNPAHDPGHAQDHVLAAMPFVVEQVGMVIAKDTVITFQERAEDVFEPVRKRLRSASGRIRNAGADYLAYALMDVMVDHYFHVFEQLGDQIEAVEEHIYHDGGPKTGTKTLAAMQLLKRELVLLKKYIWPLRDVVSSLRRDTSNLISPDTQPYFNDVHDHVVQVIELIEAYRDILTGLGDLYLTMLGNRTNTTMQMLTVIATIFMPLTFIAGIYGMNFEYMPELHWRYGYGLVWGLMAAIALVMVGWFKKKRML
ncbi:MAG: magnesium/cobalt transporter CorA [Cyanobacteria bacterium HKST-UBA04]|nr:magnesium/cobalt transporter CorA [Cyanobacteria bacterium HKST-UBA04]